eukprot:COSAG01_NODE_7082_length_3361_cov_1.988964_1_plen_96_part_10
MRTTRWISRVDSTTCLLLTIDMSFLYSNLGRHASKSNVNPYNFTVKSIQFNITTQRDDEKSAPIKFHACVRCGRLPDRKLLRLHDQRQCLHLSQVT